VETPEQLQFLRAAGCNLMQGYLLSRAIAAMAFAELLRSEAATETTNLVPRTGMAG
jgi:EAL domain-containing protein (putative c-di-GMP-specific phosphodiesterase class I)